MAECDEVTYTVQFVYRRKTYSNTFQSYTKITPDTDNNAAWGLADEAIKATLETIPNRPPGVYPHSIVIFGPFGNLTIKK